MKRIDASLVSLVGFAASQWAEVQASNGSRHKRRLMQLREAALEMHVRSSLYASAPELLRALQRVASHASIAVELTAKDEMPEMRTLNPGQGACRRNGQEGRQGNGAK
jgi:hypothetical protein